MTLCAARGDSLTRGDLEMFWRFASGIHGYLKKPLTGPECSRIVGESERDRADNFLFLLRRGVYDNPRSPYLQLLRNVRAEFGDIERDVRANGVEAAAGNLYRAGVYGDFEEFKGTKLINRSGLSLQVHADDFDNPLLSRDFEVQSGGSLGTRRRMAIDLDLLVYESAVCRLFYEGASVLDRPRAIWRPVPPGSSGIKYVLATAKLGLPLERWFSPSPWKWTGGMWPSAVLTSLVVAASKLSKGRIPHPEYVPLDDPTPVARWMAERVAAGKPPLLSASASAAVRVASTGLDLSGAVFELGGEALTEEKLRAIEACGASTLIFYALSETGPLGVGCSSPKEIDEVHLISGKIAVGQRKVVTPNGSMVDALLLTTLYPSTPKLLLNVDIGDYGVVEEGSCGCAMERLGFKRRLHSIRSYEKLTAGGMHFTASDVLTLLEEVLPSVHGGAAGDYQLVQTEPDGLSIVEIVVSPRVELRDRARVVGTVLDRPIRVMRQKPSLLSAR